VADRGKIVSKQKRERYTVPERKAALLYIKGEEKKNKQHTHFRKGGYVGIKPRRPGRRKRIVMGLEKKEEKNVHSFS